MPQLMELMRELAVFENSLNVFAVRIGGLRRGAAKTGDVLS